MRWQVTKNPSVEPVSLVEMKLHLRVDATADDTLIAALTMAAREWCEVYEGRSYMAQTITAYMDTLQSVILPRPPLVSVSSLKYYDVDGTQQTLATSYYDVDVFAEPGRVLLAYNQTWPSTRLMNNAVEIIYQTGYMTKFTASGATLTGTEAIFTDGDTVELTNDIDDLPGGLSEKTRYWVRDVTGLTFSLAATSGGAAITTSDDGTGVSLIGERLVPERVRSAIKLLTGHLYEHREQASEIKLDMIPFSVINLLTERSFS